MVARKWPVRGGYGGENDREKRKMVVRERICFFAENGVMGG